MTSPKVGTVWRQRSAPDRLYVIYDVTNTETGNPDYPRRVSYADSAGNHYSRTVDEWNSSYELIEEGMFNYPEQEFLVGQAIHIFHSIDELCRRFRVVRMSVAERRKNART